MAAEKGEQVKLGNVRIETHTAVPPVPYDEASLLRMMAKNGIGTEATRVDAINSLVRDKVADASVSKNRSFCRQAPTVIKPTMWGKWLHSALPPTVTGQHMTDHVAATTDAARHDGFNLERHLFDATKWLANVIHSSPVRNNLPQSLISKSDQNRCFSATFFLRTRAELNTRTTESPWVGIKFSGAAAGQSGRRRGGRNAENLGS